MKLQDRLPDGVTVDGRFYRLDFDFRNVLRMMEVMARADLMPEAREYMALKCLTKHPPRNVPKVLEAVRALLFEKPPKADAKKVTDFVQDAGLIRAAFRQAYGIDLYRDRLHWIEFSELLNAIPEGNRYSEVIGIRVRPIPSPTKWNSDERAWLMKAKADVALEVSDEEREKNYRQDVAGIAAALLAWAGENNAK
jgi:hypothetical protein